MIKIDILIKKFVKFSKQILKNNLIGIYLHGSLAMGCFNELSSDIDLIVVVSQTLTKAGKQKYLDMVVKLNEEAPKKGIEMSIVLKDYCKSFIYPTPFELHFSTHYLDLYKKNPNEYLEKVKGTDPDLAAHFTVIYHRGKTLYGDEVKNVFEEVNQKFYFDSIYLDIKDAKEEIIKNPVYLTLNLCRVLAFKKEGLILSKEEGAKWGMNNLLSKYHLVIKQALNEYRLNKKEPFNQVLLKEYANYMLEKINA